MEYVITILLTMILQSILIILGFIMVKHIKDNESDPSDFADYMNMLNIIIDNEINIYTQDVFRKGILLDSKNYPRYVKEVSESIVSSLPKAFYKRCNKFMTTKAINTLVVRKVKVALQEKIKEELAK